MKEGVLVQQQWQEKPSIFFTGTMFDRKMSHANSRNKDIPCNLRLLSKQHFWAP